MAHVGFKDAEIEGIFKVVAGILHLGNIKFSGNDKSHVSTKSGLYFLYSPPSFQPSLLTFLFRGY